MNGKFKRRVLDACEAALVRHGFRRVRMHTIALDISPDFQGWVGLNTGLYHDRVCVAPAVGIHCVPLMRLICSLDERHYKVSDIATFAFSLNTFKKGIDPFNFMSEEDLEHESERLASFVEQYVPLMRDFSSYEAVVAVSKWRSDMLGGYPEKAAAALFLMGRSEEARAWLAIQLEHFRLKERSTFEPFEEFASRLLHLIETEEVSAPAAAASSSAHLDARWDHLRGSYL